MPANDVTVTANFAAITNTPELTPVISLGAWMRDGLLHVTGLNAGETLSVYSAGGALVYQSIATGEEMDISVTAQGIYLVRSGDRTVRVVFSR